MSTALVEQASRVRGCMFALAGELFAVDVRCAREVVIFDDHTRVPGAPSYLIGVANLRGHILPVLDIRPLLGLPSARLGHGIQALVVEVSGVQVAIAIESVLGLEYFKEILPFGDATRRVYGEVGVGLLRREGSLVTLLDALKILAALHVVTPPGRETDAGDDR